MYDRRVFLRGAAAAVAGVASASEGRTEVMSYAGQYDVDRSIVNLDAAYYGAMTRATSAAYRAHGEWVNRHNALFLRSALPGPTRDERLQPATDAVASLIGARPEEVALCGGGTEALYGLIVNYRRLKTGDAVLMADVDYDEMQHAMAYLETSRGVRPVRMKVPEPATTANILAAYEVALQRTPEIKLVLLTHVSNRNGLVLPVREIADMARRHGADVILDSAQSVGLLPVDVDALGIDFMGFSLHKWVAAPLGTGAIYIRKSRLADIDPWLGNHIRSDGDVRARAPTGTMDFAARLTVPHAVREHLDYRPEHKLAHLTRMRARWVEGVRAIPGLIIAHPDEPGRVAVIGAFRLSGQRSWADAQHAQKVLLEKYQVLVVAKQGLASGPVLRVTPSLFNTNVEIDRMIDAVRAERNLFT
jgi:selenocysteine lyase/cysteine desulfurase